MQPRLKPYEVAPEAYKLMRNLEMYVRNSGLEHSLLELVKMRSSQLNGCAYCLDMHSKDARAAGETEQRLYALNAWRETSFFSERERAALAWAEALTRISERDQHIDDALYEQVRGQFDEKEMVDLSLAICTINTWNRLAISFRAEAGTYQVPKSQRAEAASTT